MTAFHLVRLADAPQHLDTVAAWNYAEWSKAMGNSLQDSVDWFRTIIVAPSEECVIAEHGKDVIGMASLVDHDLDERPDLLHWLASVYVDPDFRKAGVAKALVKAVEREAAQREMSRIHLYTNTAEQLYSGLGWTKSECFKRGPERFTLMHKDLREPATA